MVEAHCVVAHPGVQHSGILASALHASGRRVRLVTRLQIGRDARRPWSIRILQSKLGRRQISSLPDELIVRTDAWIEVIERLMLRRLPSKVGAALTKASIKHFERRVVSKIGPEVAIVIGTDTASSSMFRELKKSSPHILRILDVSHPLDQIAQELVRKDSEEFGFPLSHYDDYRTNATIDQSDELRLADRILVASAFTAEGLVSLGVDPVKIHIVPYGVDIAVVTKPTIRSTEMFRLIFVGALSERKGISLLLAAMRKLESERVPVRLDIVGRSAAGYVLPEPLPGNVFYHGSVSGERLDELFCSADLLVLPSMCEGFGRIILEALSFGVGVLATERSGAPDILDRCPHAPVFILPVEDRTRMADVIAQFVTDRGRINPADATVAATKFSTSAYTSALNQALWQVAE